MTIPNLGTLVITTPAWVRKEIGTVWFTCQRWCHVNSITTKTCKQNCNWVQSSRTKCIFICTTNRWGEYWSGCGDRPKVGGEMWLSVLVKAVFLLLAGIYRLCFFIYAAGLPIVCSPTIDKMLKNDDYFRTNCKFKLQT